MIKRIVFLCLLFAISINLSYADYDTLLMADKQKTIKELKENIEDLDKVKHDKRLKLEEEALNVNLKTFLKENLSLKDNLILGKIVSDYNKSRLELEDKLIETSKKLEDTTQIYIDLLELRKKFYTDILDFVDINKYSSYLYYINEQANFYIEEKELDSDIIKKSEIVNEKITTIEEKIIEHKIFMEETLSDLIDTKIEERLDFIKNDTTFEKLTLEGKIVFLNNVIERIEEMKKGYSEDNQKEDVLASIKASNEKKIEICTLIAKKFEDYKMQLLENSNVTVNIGKK